jgi:hypothetical protein
VSVTASAPNEVPASAIPTLTAAQMAEVDRMAIES